MLVAGQTGGSACGDRDALYFRSNSGLWRVGKQRRRGGGLSLPAARGKNVDHLVADETHFVLFLGDEQQRQYRVARMPKRGGAPGGDWPGLPTRRDGSALSDSHVYFFRAADLTDDALAKVEKAGR